MKLTEVGILASGLPIAFSMERSKWMTKVQDEQVLVINGTTISSTHAHR